MGHRYHYFSKCEKINLAAQKYIFYKFFIVELILCSLALSIDIKFLSDFKAYLMTAVGYDVIYRRNACLHDQ